MTWIDSATTAIELRRLVVTVDGLMQNSAQRSILVDALTESQQVIALIFVFLLAILVYRFFARRFIAI